MEEKPIRSTSDIISVTRTLRFWIDEPKEKCESLLRGATQMQAAYNAMLELWETEIRAEVCALVETEGGRWKRVWKSSARRDEPAAGWRKRLMDVAKAAASDLMDPAVRQMYSAEFTRDVGGYLDRRYWSKEHAGLRRRGRPMVVALNAAGCGWKITKSADGVSAVLPMWNTSDGVSRLQNALVWRLSPVESKHRAGFKQWTLNHLSGALATGKVGGCKVIPPDPNGHGKARHFWKLHVVVETRELVELNDPRRVAGVDLGLKHFAVYSCPEAKSFLFCSSRDLKAKMERVRREKRGVPRARRQVIGGANGRRQDTFCRLVSRRIVDACIRDRVGTLRVENLDAIREAAGDDANHRFALGACFPYFTFQVYLHQACKRAGITLEFVNPRNTSARCSRCGHICKDSRNGKRFVCVACGYQSDADLNAANNIASWAPKTKTPATFKERTS